jgi:hypothetical protein
LSVQSFSASILSALEDNNFEKDREEAFYLGAGDVIDSISYQIRSGYIKNIYEMNIALDILEDDGAGDNDNGSSEYYEGFIAGINRVDEIIKSSEFAEAG